MDSCAEGLLKYLIELLEYYLGELNGLEANCFFLGEKYAYVECLEIIQKWEGANSLGLDYDVKKRFLI